MFGLCSFKNILFLKIWNTTKSAVLQLRKEKLLVLSKVSKQFLLKLLCRKQTCFFPSKNTVHLLIFTDILFSFIFVIPSLESSPQIVASYVNSSLQSAFHVDIYPESLQGAALYAHTGLSLAQAYKWAIKLLMCVRCSVGYRKKNI